MGEGDARPVLDRRQTTTYPDRAFVAVHVQAAEKWEYLSWHEAQVMARQQLAAENAEKKDVAKPSQVEVEEQRVVRDDREGGVQLAAEKLEAAKSPQIKDGGEREPAKAPLEPSRSVGHAVVATPAVGAAISEMLEKFEASLEAAGHQAGANLRESLDWIRAEIKHDLAHAVDSLLVSRPAAGPANYNFDKMAADVLNGVAQRLGEVARGKDEEEKGKGKGGQRPYPGPRLEDQLAATIDVMTEKFGRAIVSALRQIVADLKNDLKTPGPFWIGVRPPPTPTAPLLPSTSRPPEKVSAAARRLALRNKNPAPYSLVLLDCRLMSAPAAGGWPARVVVCGR